MITKTVKLKKYPKNMPVLMGISVLCTEATILLVKVILWYLEPVYLKP